MLTVPVVKKVLSISADAFLPALTLHSWMSMGLFAPLAQATVSPVLKPALIA